MSNVKVRDLERVLVLGNVELNPDIGKELTGSTRLLGLTVNDKLLIFSRNNGVDVFP